MAEPRVLDITPTLSPQTAVWPGDTPLSREVLADIDAGSHLDLSTLRTTVHIGAHADGPRHYRRGAPDIASRNPARYLGPCQVVEVDVARGARIHPTHVSVEILAPRILFKTGTFPNPNAWNEDFAALSPQLIRWLHGSGVHLVGLDTPSIDPMDSKALQSHQAVADLDMAILEGLVLGEVPAGVYTLVALPLPLDGFDASPVRAILIEGQRWPDLYAR